MLGGYDIPAGSNVLLPLYLLHRDGRFWKDPERFWPERFAPEQRGRTPTVLVHAFRGRSAALHRRDFRACMRC